MKKYSFLVALFFVIIVTFACSKEEYQTVAYDKYFGIGGGGWQKLHVSALPIRVWAKVDRLNHDSKIEILVVSPDYKDSDKDNENVCYIDADKYVQDKEDKTYETLKFLINKAIKQREPIELYGTYVTYGPLDKYSSGSSNFNIHKVKVANKLFDIR